MLPERPDVNEYIALNDDLADVKDHLLKLEYSYEKKVAANIRTAMNRGAKTRELDVIKILGNNDEEEKYLDSLVNNIHDTKKAVSILYGKINAWQSRKELYRSDLYNQVGGYGSWSASSKHEGE